MAGISTSTTWTLDTRSSTLCVAVVSVSVNIHVNVPGPLHQVEPGAVAAGHMMWNFAVVKQGGGPTHGGGADADAEWRGEDGRRQEEGK